MHMIVNVCVVWLLWIPFRTEDFSTCLTIIQRIFTMADGVSYIFVYTLIYMAIIMGYQIFSYIKYDGKSSWQPLNLDKFKNKVVFIAFILLIICFSYIGDTAFIYAQF